MAQDSIETAFTLISGWGLRVVGAIAVLILGRWIAGLTRRALRRSLVTAKADESLIPFTTGIAYYLVLAVVVIAVLSLFGIETTSLIAVLGAAGLAVGLALQGTLSNFAAGVMLLVFRPFKAGDFVEVAGTKGTVAEIGIFSTVLNTPDNVKITIPNGTIYGQTISNYSAYDIRRNDLVLGIHYNDDIGVAMNTIREVLSKDPRVLADPAPVVAVGELADSSVNLVVRPWCRSADYWPLRFDLTRALKEQIETAGCSIPFPQRDVHMIAPAPPQ